MTELLPSLQAEQVRSGLVDYLTTTFALADAEPRAALAEFLEDPTDGIFKGPYVRLRMPFRRVTDDETVDAPLDWKPPFPPYRHQLEAYRRLTSKDLGPDKPRPLPTVVTTGTGSGKTEAFLNPIIDHVLRARRRGEGGLKALILYPMNALADDQAGRLTTLLTTDPVLANVTAGLYTGDARAGQPGGGRTRVSADGLITNREVLREDPPDILLTNYKMLDQLLLRPEDQPLWNASALSLAYVVLDEFHTYDGAQGTDVSMLLRRLGLTLRSHVPSDHTERAMFDERPLGKVTPVATSATLGGGHDSTAMRAFAAEVFGEEFPPEAAITETRVDVEDYTESARTAVAEQGLTTVRLAQLLASQTDELAAIGARFRDDGERLTKEVVGFLYSLEAPPDTEAMADLLVAHEDVRQIIERAAEAIHLDALTEAMLPAPVARMASARNAFGAILAALSHGRLHDRHAISVEVTLWVREVSRVDRVAASTPGFRWTDDGEVVDAADSAEPPAPALPAIYCRGCGRSGWGVGLTPTGRDLSEKVENIRRDHANKTGRFRALLHAPGEAALVTARALEGDPNPEQHAPNLRWLHIPRQTILLRRPAEDDADLLEGRVLPVLVLDGDTDEIEKASKRDDCPSCGRQDQIRFLGSAISTLLSVSLSTLFGDPDLDTREKRSLIFTDSVQDAAHRAGFVDHRSHALALRAALRGALSEPMPLSEWVETVLRHAEPDGFTRYRLVPASLLEHSRFRPYWATPDTANVPAAAVSAVRRRLLFDTTLEVGLQTSYGRTLEATGAIGVHVDAGPPNVLIDAARRALGDADRETLPVALAEISDTDLLRWVRGTLEHLRHEGAIEHEWLKKYIDSGGARVWIWGKRNRTQGAPAFPSQRSAPSFPTVGGKVNDRSTFVRVTSPQSWYARWAQKCLGIGPGHAASLAAGLLAELARRDVLSETTMSVEGRAYALPTDAIRVTPLQDLDHERHITLLACDTCRSPLPVSPSIAAQLSDGPCPTVACRGTVRATPRERESFYRRMFATSAMRRVDAREHTSLLEAEERREIEAGFKRPEQRPGDPNVLVATPTLEMGIDIGDLTTVMLSSLPDSVAKYLQRVGRGGRLTGSSLVLAYLTGRGEQLPRLGEPTSMINGEVRPPATYLDAEEILRRQFIASVIDGMVRDGYEPMPRTANRALRSSEPGTLLGDLLARMRTRGPRLVDAFAATFPDPEATGLTALRSWALPAESGPDAPTTVEADGPTQDTLEATVHRAVSEYTHELDQLRRRRREVEDSLPNLRERSQLPGATDDDKNAYRSAISSSQLLRFVIRDITTDTWIGGLELRGLLPNYLLIDDEVRLDAQVSWVDPETQQFDSSSLVIGRGSARALVELAPGAHFYARGLELKVDGIEIGTDDAEIVHWVGCDTCGHLHHLPSGDSPSPTVCPRCGSTGIADTGQRFDAVRLKRVFSDVRQDDAQIGDSHEDRRRTRFELLPAVDFDSTRLERQWAVETIGLGVSHYRRLPVRWFNLGRATGAPAVRRIAGRDVIAQQFRVCEACGKLDSDAGVSSAHEHRAWCRYRQDPEEHTRLLSLGRELVTQGVAITLPENVTDDAASVSSLAAAVLLGLREVMGGTPDHLRVLVTPHPVGGDAGHVRDALLLHDTVPGGTGYLTHLASPDELWKVLVTAAQKLARCPCQDEGRSSCHLCLLPFMRDAQEPYRVVALRALERLLEVDGERTVLDLDPEAAAWATVDAPVDPGWGESALEQRFRREFADRVRQFATVVEKPGPRGPELRITGIGDRVWWLRPQVLMHGTRPDFVLETGGGPTIAIYTDGQSFHASLHTNRLADDAAKRDTLRSAGIRVVAVTFQDLDRNGSPDWIPDQIVSALMASPQGACGSGISRGVADEQRHGPLALLGGILQDPGDEARTRLANAAALLLSTRPGTARHHIAQSDDLAAVGVGQLHGTSPTETTGEDDLLSYRTGHMVFAARFRGSQPREVLLLLDDSAVAIEQPDHEESWREWLRISNLLTMSDVPYAITTTSRLDAASGPAGPDAVAQALTGGWEHVDLEDTDGEVVALVNGLSSAGVEPAEGGIALGTESIGELGWEQARVTVVYADMPEPEIEAIRADGWTVFRASEDVERLVNAIRESLSDRLVEKE